VLSQIDLRYFKCFDLLRLPLCPLTLLTGSNASGKSSVLQALVLLHQSVREHEWSTRLMLNGGVTRLGTVSDVVDKVHGRRTIGIGLVDGNLPYDWQFVGERSELSMAVDCVVVGDAAEQRPEVLRYLLPPSAADASASLSERLRRLTYITAERIGPRDVYDLVDPQTTSVVGPAGEYAASVLYSGRDETVLDELALVGAPHTRFRQVEERMRTFFPGCALMLQQVPQVNAVTLGFRTSDDTDFHRPTNVGFGLTQILPIIIAALASARDDIVLVENPEVHLHPAGQALMGQFLAEVARAGVQVIAETHSDHILNGIRRSVRGGRLDPKDVAIHFFRPRSQGEAHVVSPLLDSEGNVDSWPAGFFDQFDKDASYFAGWGK